MARHENVLSGNRRSACGTVHTIATILALLIASLQAIHAEPWNLPTYRVCRQVRLSGIDHEVSGVTYNPITNSLWVVTRRPPVIGEYSVTGRKLRTVRHRNLVDPEGITWMFDYTFAVAEEGRGRGYAITVMDAEPWRREVRVRKKIDLSRLPDQNSNNGLEAVAFDPKYSSLPPILAEHLTPPPPYVINEQNNMFYVTQEQSPMRIWRVGMDGRSRQILAGKPSGRFYGRDFAGMHYRPGDNGLYILSEAGESIHKVGFDGVTQGEPLRGIKGRMPEGLTFTPDGALMIVAGEPNEMFFYTSIGTCDWRPGTTLPDYPSFQYDDQGFGPEKTPLNEEVVLSLKLEGITPDQFAPLAQVYYKAALAITAYGGSLDVLPLVSMPRVTSSDGAIFTEVHIKVRDGEDAEALRKTVEYAIETRAFYATLASLGFPDTAVAVTVVEDGTDGEVEHVDGPDGAPYTSGFEGYVTLRLIGVPEDSLTPLNQLYLRSAVAAVAYKSTQAHTWVAITDTSPLQGGVGAKVRILAITLEHAQMLVSRVSAAIASGELLAELRALHADYADGGGGIQLGAISFRESEVPPEDFPTSELSAMAEQSSSLGTEDGVEWVYAFADDSPAPAAGPPTASSPVNIAIMAACAAVGAAVASAVIAVAHRHVARKRARLADDSDSDEIEMEEQAQAQRPRTSALFGSPARPPASRLASPKLGSRLKSPPRVPRSPSNCNLLNPDGSGDDDAASAPAHSRDGSVTLGADSFMQRLRAAGVVSDGEEEPLSCEHVDLEAPRSGGEE